MSGEGTRFKIKDNMGQNGQIKPAQPNVTEEKYYIHPKLKEDLEGIVATVQHLDRFGTEMGHRNYLFVGPPGTGKTLGVQYVATKLQCPLYDAKGVSNPQQVSQLYNQLREIAGKGKQKVILMLDEVDALVEKKGAQSWKSSWTGLLQSKLSKPIEGVYMIGTMNRPDLINDTFVQRFPHRLYFGMPSPTEQEAIWRKYLPSGIEAKALVEANGKLTGRNIAHAAHVVKDYGLEPSVEIYKQLIANIKPAEGIDYEEIRNQVGDAVRDYDNVKRFLAEQAGEKK